MSKCFNIGCSFALGNRAISYGKLVDKHICPGDLFGDYFNLECVNIARNGNSLDGILRDLYVTDISKDSLIVIGIPPADRQYMLSHNDMVIDKNERLNGLARFQRSEEFNLLRKSRDPEDIARINEIKKCIKLCFSSPVRPQTWVNTCKYLKFSLTEVCKAFNARKPSLKVDAEKTLEYHQLLKILAIQGRLREMGNSYILWNAMSTLKKEYLDKDLNSLKDQIDFRFYYKPYEMLWDMTSDARGGLHVNTKYSVHIADSHPNHKCYIDWFKGVKEWIIDSGFKLNY